MADVASWGVCTTAKAPLPQLLAFVAWHKHIGAARIWVHLDDADAVSGSVLNQIDGVTAILCDDAYWAVRGKRPAKQEPRQSYNMQRVYGLAELPIIAHVDVDEFLHCEGDIGAVLASADPDLPFLRVAPAEALHDPALKDDIFTARQFRLPFAPRLSEARKTVVLGPYAPLLATNMMSHRVGKSFFRTGLDGFVPKIHAGAFGDQSKPMSLPMTAGIHVLHFHAQDRAAWLAALPHRTVNGAYRFNAPLAAFLAEASADEVKAFYQATQVATPRLTDALTAQDLLIEANLKLRDKIDALEF